MSYSSDAGSVAGSANFGMQPTACLTCRSTRCASFLAFGSVGYPRVNAGVMRTDVGLRHIRHRSRQGLQGPTTPDFARHTARVDLMHL
jgi:hypothetical protein